MPRASKNSSLAEIITRGLVATGGGNIVARILEIGIGILLLRWLTIFEFGVYRLSLAAYNFGSSFFLDGVDNLVVADVSRALQTNPRSAKSLFSVYTYLLTLTGVVLWVVFFFGSNLLAHRFHEGAEYVRMISFLFLLAPIEDIYKLKFQVFLDFGWANIFKILRDIIRIGAIFFLVSLSHFGVREALWSLIAAVAGPIAVIIIGYHRDSLFVIPSWQEAKSAFSVFFFQHGKWAFFDDFVNGLSKSVRPVIVKIFVGTEAVGILEMVTSLMGYIVSAFPLKEVLIPVLPRSYDAPVDLAGKITRGIKYGTIAFILLGVVAALAAPVLIYFLFPKYLVVLPFFYLILLAFPANGVRAMVVPLLNTLKKQRLLFLYDLVMITLIAGVSALLSNLFGLWGATFEIFILGYVSVPIIIFVIQRALPEWRFSRQNFFRLDTYDREMLWNVWENIKRWLLQLVSFLSF